MDEAGRVDLEGPACSATTARSGERTVHPHVLKDDVGARTRPRHGRTPVDEAGAEPKGFVGIEHIARSAAYAADRGGLHVCHDVGRQASAPPAQASTPDDNHAGRFAKKPQPPT